MGFACIMSYRALGWCTRISKTRSIMMSASASRVSYNICNDVFELFNDLFEFLPVLGYNIIEAGLGLPSWIFLLTVCSIQRTQIRCPGSMSRIGPLNQMQCERNAVALGNPEENKKTFCDVRTPSVHRPTANNLVCSDTEAKRCRHGFSRPRATPKSRNDTTPAALKPPHPSAPPTPRQNSNHAACRC